MKLIQHAFVVIHIRISHVKIFKLKARNIATFVLILLLVISLFNLISYDSVQSFVIALIYTLSILYISVFWIITWPIANKLLNKASDMEYEAIEKEISGYTQNQVESR